jgi:hypothetical protein
VRLPAEDRALVCQGVEQARYHQREIESCTARLIAGHLHRGPGSSLCRFAVSGAIDDRLYAELDEAAVSPRRYIRSCASAPRAIA